MKKIIFILLFLLVPLRLFADATPADELQKALAGFDSVKANFKQAIYDSNKKFLQQSSGNMALKRPGKFRWYTHQPGRQLIIANGDKLWIYDNDLDQVTIQNLRQTSGNAMAILLSDSVDKIKSNFTIELLNNETKKQVFKLTPLTPDPLFKWVKLYFEDGKLKQIRYGDELAQETQLNFLNITQNVKLGNGLFTFTPPKGVDVIDNYQSIN